MFTIKTKIIVSVSLVLGIVFFAFGAFIYQQVKSANYVKVDVHLESLSQKLRDEIDEQFEKHKFPRTAKLQRLVAENLPASVFRLYDSTGATIYGDSILSTTKISTLRKILTWKSYTDKISIDHTRYRSLWRHIEIEDEVGWILQVATPLSEVEENLDQLELVLWTTIPFALIFAAIAVYVIVRKAFKPLSTMIETANRVSASNLNERLTLPHRHDEVTVLGSALNRMIERIEAAFKSQKQFIADASHEIRTPITIIQSELEYANRSSLANSAKQSIHLALDELDHLRKLAGDLLLLAKLEISDATIDFRSVRVDELIADCVRKVSRMSAEKNITLQLTIENIIEITADEEKLRSALLNLIENAIKYTPEGGSVSMTLQADKEIVRMIVHDTGVGISPDDIRNIFKPFYRSATSRATHIGSGLGLSIVQRIVDLHHGNIFAESDGTTGSTFTVELPVAPPQ